MTRECRCSPSPLAGEGGGRRPPDEGLRHPSPWPAKGVCPRSSSAADAVDDRVYRAGGRRWREAPDEGLHNETPLRHRARRRHEQAQPHRLLAHARGPIMSTVCRRATPPVPRARTFRAGSATRKPANTRRLARADRKQSAARRHGPRLLSPLRDRSAIARRSTRRSASIRSSVSSATSRSPKAGLSTSRSADTGKRVLVVGAGPAGLSAAYHLRRLGHERRRSARPGRWPAA